MALVVELQLPPVRLGVAAARAAVVVLLSHQVLVAPAE
jgi:hypothetical protein